ncbi:unnamed protein product [Trifolium pratense]|uniref:Uncharacterized protein n=1 Tax=Trifolium pratense TaxID=57577 RepID=A0ACB0JS46_TRIPR|nr:unnamed protein product [Trifolium pratense]
MAASSYADSTTSLGGRLQKCIFTTIHVKDDPFGEIDPVFVHKYSDELHQQWKVYAGNHLHLLSWNQSLRKPLITDGWTELREHFELQFQYHEINMVYYGDSMFQLLLPLTGPIPTNEFPSFHSLSTKLSEPLTFEILLSNNSIGSRDELVFNKWLGDYITSFHNYLVLEGPVAEPHLVEIIQRQGGNGIRELEYLQWHKFNMDNYLSAGDLLKFTFFDIKNSNRVDVDVDRVVR